MKIVVVLGHSGCGAVSAAVNVFLDPSRYLALATSHSLRNILDRLLVVVQASAKRMHEVLGPDITQCPGYRVALIETLVVVSAAPQSRVIERAKQ
jgi:carbonic anhydrase